MKRVSVILFAMCLLTACSEGRTAGEPSSEGTTYAAEADAGTRGAETSAAETPATETSAVETRGAESSAAETSAAEAQVGNIYLYGEQHGVKAIYDRELELWKDHYEKEHMRHLFVELPYYTAQYLNLWMESGDDQILDEIYDDWEHTASHVEDYKTFFKQIKEACPETVFHGTDVGHQYATTGQRYVDRLLEMGQKDSNDCLLAQENIEQGKTFYEANDSVYREQKMVENFCREAEALKGEAVMGIYGGAHLGGNVSGTDTPSMAVQLRERYGEKVSGEDLTMVGKENLSPLKTEIVEVEGKEYTASYFGKEDLAGQIQGLASRQFWRLEDAYDDFAEAEKSGDVLPYNNYPMAVEKGQVFMIEYQKTDGSLMTLFYRSDGNEWNGMLTTEGILVDKKQKIH